MTTDRTLAVVYLPTARAITIDMSRFRDPVVARWFDPTNGTYSAATDGSIPNAGLRQFKPNRANRAGDSDWVLVLTAANT